MGATEALSVRIKDLNLKSEQAKVFVEVNTPKLEQTGHCS
jgi:hypothetical protein